MSEFNYLKEKVRMLREVGCLRGDGSSLLCEDCHKCPISIHLNCHDVPCATFENKYPDEAIEIVRKWSEEHPRKTRKDVLLEKFPNAKLDSSGHPHVCAQNLGITEKCPPGNSCIVCWDTEVEE